jgi:hypothetical protein
MIVLASLCIVDAGLFAFSFHQRAQLTDSAQLFDIATAGLGLTDLCIATEARYTRHPAVSDRTVPFMDYPGAIEHFPTGSFWAPPEIDINSDQVQ